MSDYDHDPDDYVCPFCRANCGPDYSEYADQHPERYGS